MLAVYLVVMAATLGGLGLVFATGSGDSPLAFWGLTGINLLAAVLLVGLVVWSVRRRPFEARGGHYLAKCSSCGATDSLEVGQMHRRCGHCGADLVPGDAAIGAGLSVAEANVRAAALAKLHAERAMFAQIGGSAAFMGVVARLSFMAVPLVGAALLYRSSVAGNEDPAAALAFGGIGIGAIVVIALLQLRKVLKKRRWRKTLCGLEDALSPGQSLAVMDDIRQVVAWLDTYWTDAYGKDYHPRNTGGSHLQAASLHMRGFPVLVNVWAPPHKNKGFVDVLVAGVPRAGGPRNSGPERAAVKALDFSFRKRIKAGLQATVEGPAFAAFATSDQSRLASVVDGVVRAAEASGLAPAPKL